MAAYIKGSRANGMMTTAKHFPGHGDAATDSHLSVARSDGNRVRLDSVELAPFRQAIAAGVDSVMVAHVTVPALEPDPNRVATTSPAIVTDLLQRQLGFQGIVVTDALDMAGLTRRHPPPSAARRLRLSKPGAICCSYLPIWRLHTTPFLKLLTAEKSPPHVLMHRCSSY